MLLLQLLLRLFLLLLPALTRRPEAPATARQAGNQQLHSMTGRQQGTRLRCLASVMLS
jgi:hypothetical protein